MAPRICRERLLSLMLYMTGTKKKHRKAMSFKRAGMPLWPLFLLQGSFQSLLQGIVIIDAVVHVSVILKAVPEVEVT